MKKILVFSLVLFLSGFILSVAKADVIMPNTHAVERCAKIVNINQYSDIVLVSYITGPTISTYQASQIQGNTCLNKGYKFNNFGIYWTTTEKFKTLDLANLNLSDINMLSSEVEPYGGTVDDVNPLIKETIEYSITKNTNGTFVLNKTKVISEFNNGASAKIETFSNTKFVFNKNLAFTQKSNEVKKLQEKLIALKYLSSENNSGYFGKNTQKALCDFQIAKGIYKKGNKSCGYSFGPMTRAKINE